MRAIASISRTGTLMEGVCLKVIKKSSRGSERTGVRYKKRLISGMIKRDSKVMSGKQSAGKSG
jgi:hypothetical protein